MRSRHLIFLIFLCSSAASHSAETLPSSDQRAKAPVTLNTPRRFPTVRSKSEWQTRAKEIREQVLVSCGLWPMPEKSPLEARVFGKIEREDYTIEKVSLQTYPGFYLAGNLYRPKGQGTGPFPGVLNPHGHWANGRMADTTNGSIAARCISFARQGMVAFSYDMVGYNDTIQVNHQFAQHPTNQLWQISLMGLQTWNSIRALDFLESLPDVDRSRLACTGESGGGTQTFMLGAIDTRLAVQAPIVMVSHSMQGGCLCENAPGLRVEHSNMEIAAAAAPRPQLLVAATGDWTKDTPTVEGPAIASVYRLFNAETQFEHVRFDFGHNYNRTSREAVYERFGRWLLGQSESERLKERSYQKEPDHDLRVWPDGKLPADALSESALIQSLVAKYQSQWESIKPKDRSSFERLKSIIEPAWRHTLQIDLPERNLLIEARESRQQGAFTFSELALGRAGRGDRVPALMITPRNDRHRVICVLAHPKGRAAYLNADQPSGLAKEALNSGHAVVLVDAFLTGEAAKPNIQEKRKPFEEYFTTYNRTDLQERVQDLITASSFAQHYSKGRRVVLCGSGQAGLWALLAAPAADAVVADCNATDAESDAALTAPELFVPGLRKIGSFQGAAALAAPRPLLLHNTSGKFRVDWLSDVYSSLEASKAMRHEKGPLDDAGVARWISQLTFD